MFGLLQLRFSLLFPNLRIKQEKPRMEQEKPRMKQEKPRMEQEKPRMEQEKPRMKQEKPRMEQEKPRKYQININPARLKPPPLYTQTGFKQTGVGPKQIASR